MESSPEVIKSGSDSAGLESDQELELALRRELAEMIRANGISEPDGLLNMLMESMDGRVSEA